MSTKYNNTSLFNLGSPVVDIKNTKLQNSNDLALIYSELNSLCENAKNYLNNAMTNIKRIENSVFLDKNAWNGLDADAFQKSIKDFCSDIAYQEFENLYTSIDALKNKGIEIVEADTFE